MKVLLTTNKMLKGTISISGSKNASLAIIPLCILCKKAVLKNVPNITDIHNLLKTLKHCNISYIYKKDRHKLILKHKTLNNIVKTSDASKIRASYYLLGAYFSIFNEYHIPIPGGCTFQARPINFHIEALKALGASITFEDYGITVKRNEIKSCEIELPVKSVGATINIILACVKSKVIVKIINPSFEPEVIDFIKALKKMGANIIYNKDGILVKGVKKLKNLKYKIMFDRIEASSYILLASSVLSCVLIKNINTFYLEPLITILKKNGIYILKRKHKLIIKRNIIPNGFDFTCDTYPSLPTDIKPILTSFCLSLKSRSKVKDLVYPLRNSEVGEFMKGKACLEIKDQTLYITPSLIKPFTYIIKDLRNGFAGVVGAIIFKDCITLENFEIILRGYEDIFIKLKKIGISAHIIR